MGRVAEGLAPVNLGLLALFGESPEPLSAWVAVALGALVFVLAAGVIGLAGVAGYGLIRLVFGRRDRGEAGDG